MFYHEQVQQVPYLITPVKVVFSGWPFRHCRLVDATRGLTLVTCEGPCAHIGSLPAQWMLQHIFQKYAGHVKLTFAMTMSPGAGTLALTPLRKISTTGL